MSKELKNNPRIVSNERIIREASPARTGITDDAIDDPQEVRAAKETIQRLRLSGISTLRFLLSEEHEWLAQHCEWMNCDAGRVILNQSENTNDVYFICSGAVKSTVYSSVGHQVIYQTMAEGTMFGEIAAIDGAPRSVHVIAESSCVLAKVSSVNFLSLMRQNPDFSLAVTRQIIDTTRFLTSRVYEFSALNVSQRIERELVRLADSDSEIEGNHLVLQNPPTHADIAGRVNTHREAVTKHLNKLSRDDIIAKRGRTLIFLDIDRLRKSTSE